MIDFTLAEHQHPGFVGKLGLTGETNVQDEEVRALDVISNDIFIEVFRHLESVSCMASEEMHELMKQHSGQQAKRAVETVLADPEANIVRRVQRVKLEALEDE